MRAETAAALRRINREFYRRHAAEFSARRESPWAGWEKVVRGVEERRGEAEALSVLDLGCGNGRLERYLGRRWGDRLTYLGVDDSSALLEIAAGRAAAGRTRFLLHDLLEPLPARLPGEPFGLVAAFGLMHHVPGRAARRALLERAAERLAPGGLLAVSFWQFGDRERFQRRAVDWQRYNRTAPEPIDVADLEEGDQLLRWGEAGDTASGHPTVRYCHWTQPAEVERLLAGLPMTAATFRADGAEGVLNLYALLERG